MLAKLLFLIPILAILIVILLFVWKKVPADKAAIVTGLGKPRYVSGAGTVVIPFLQRIDSITLENIPLDVNITNTKTSLGVPINVDGYVLLKVKNSEESVLSAMQQFACCNEKQTVDMIKSQASEVCKGKLREIVSSMSVEQIYDDREAFSAKVQEVAGSELAEMGLELKSFTINDINDNVQYIEALGKKQIADVKAKAAIAEAEAFKEQEIKTAEARKLAAEAKAAADAQIAQAEKEKNLKLLAFKEEQDAKKAITDASYKIQENITSKDVKSTAIDAMVLQEQRQKEIEEAKVQAEIIAEQKRIELAQKRAERAEAQLLETVVKPAEAAKQARIYEAEAKKAEEIAKAEAEAKKLELEGNARAEIIRLQGEAEAEAIRRKGLAEAEALEKKAEALAKMNEAGKLQMAMEVMPEIAKAVAEPLSRIDKISIIGGAGDGADGVSNVVGYTTQAMTAVTEAMKDTIGFDMTDVLKAKTINAYTDRNISITADEAVKEIAKEFIKK